MRQPGVTVEERISLYTLLEGLAASVTLATVPNRAPSDGAGFDSVVISWEPRE